jgi:hypothetical protein
MRATPVADVKAADVCASFDLSDEARLLLREDQPALDFLTTLTESGKFTDAVRFVAHLLPKRIAVWWACQCARQAAGNQLAAREEAAVKAAEKWVAEPDEETRYATFLPANQAGLGTAAGCAAMAAFASGGSLAPPDDPVVAPLDELAAQMVAGSVLIAAATDPEKMADNSRAFVEQGRKLCEEARE